MCRGSSSIIPVDMLVIKTGTKPAALCHFLLYKKMLRALMSTHDEGQTLVNSWCLLSSFKCGASVQSRMHY